MALILIRKQRKLHYFNKKEKKYGILCIRRRKSKGEDGDIWRYRFISENGYWLEEKPQIVYGLNDFSDEILIQELENRGYQCIVNNKNMEIDDIER